MSQAPIELRYELRPKWPPLTWRAVCDPNGQTATVEHGHAVETAAQWFCEATWAGEYETGDFDMTDLVSGSGGRVRGDRLTFVSSGSTVDRLHFYRGRGGSVYVSNSLVCLLATCDLQVEPTYDGYEQDFASIIRGLSAYHPTLSTKKGAVTLTYFHNLRWEGGALTTVEKPRPERTFVTFDEYGSFLRTSLRAIGANMRAPGRRLRYESLSALSAGYDSSMVTVLAADTIGLREVMTFAHARGGADDSGEPLARILGLKVFAFDRSMWRSRPEAIIPFFAANAAAEDVHFTAAESILPGRVLFTGYHGDKMWDPHTEDLGPNIVRGAPPSGVSLTEYRLWAGFLHCPVPFFGAREIGQIHAISTSPEMKPWDVGGHYTRPICRRVVEGAGVPRALFGNAKHGTSNKLRLPTESFLPAESLAQYRAWLRRRSLSWLGRARVPPLVTARASSLLGYGLGRHTLLVHVFPWAIEAAMRRYQEGG